MRLSLNWLLSWLQTDLTPQHIAEKMTMAGLEVEGFAAVANDFTDIVVGEIVATDKHPNADKLTVCQVEVGQAQPLQIVCGATNARPGIKVAVALIGAKLPDLTIKAAKLRGVASSGMLCSAAELGLMQESQGIIELPVTAAVGENLREYLDLNDLIIDVSITPNRGDCLSALGLARELSAILGHKLALPAFETNQPTSSLKPTVKVSALQQCANYTARIIEEVNLAHLSPMWLVERLRRSNIRSINIIVDVMNYVMLELGQPMHAFDLEKITGTLHVRLSKAGEVVDLLDGSRKILDAETLVIADDHEVHAIAGVMGGMNSAVTHNTRAVILESAYFSPASIARQRQFYNLHSDSAYRFERGVDPCLQAQALERATQLITELAEGRPGPIAALHHNDYLPHQAWIAIDATDIENLLGFSPDEASIVKCLQDLNFAIKKCGRGWQVQPPSYRFDISIKADVVEEVARIYGYDKLPTKPLAAQLVVNQHGTFIHEAKLKEALVHQGFYEVITYSFIDQELQNLFSAQASNLALINPMSIDMAVMRNSLWPGLLTTCKYNLSRQQKRMRLFELGNVFIPTAKSYYQERHLSGLITGERYTTQWGMRADHADFYDLKGVVENLLSHLHSSQITYQECLQPGLHPGQSAVIRYNNQEIGSIGALHPQLMQALDIEQKIFLFSLKLDNLISHKSATYKPISKFPEIRRDLALLVAEAIPSANIQATIKEIAGDWLNDVFVFDLYQGKGIAPGSKSIALGMVLQHPSRTLVDDEVAELMQRIILALKDRYGAELRS